jgi:AraC-like DNA-binding protein
MRSRSLDIPIERIEHQEDLPLRAFIHSVRHCASHQHRDCEFLLCLRGTVFVTTATGETRLEPDDLFFVHSHELHLTRGSVEPNLLAALQADVTVATRLDPDFQRRQFGFNELARRRPDDPRLQAVRGLFAEILWEMRLRRPGYRLMAESRVLQLLGLLVRDIPSKLGPAASALAEGESDEALGRRLARIVAHIEARSAEPLTSAGLASTEDVSVSYLARLFKERLGTTFAGYVRQVRLRQSLPHLATGKLSVLDLALACGFPNVKSYNEAFQSQFRMTPTAWRRSQGGVVVAGLGESAYGAADTGLGYHLLQRHLPAASPLRTK